MEKSISRRIAEFAHTLTFDDLPENVVVEIKRFLYDSIGCAYGAYATKDVEAIRNI
ncbi:MAG: MmgE/PrpD family protein, partial [Ignavibacteriales bacterium]|nr:MmgE/PrpD family protein [Ignavibacteriales bacterium]